MTLLLLLLLHAIQDLKQVWGSRFDSFIRSLHI
jgi:hypothetical protein